MGLTSPHLLLHNLVAARFSSFYAEEGTRIRLNNLIDSFEAM